MLQNITIWSFAGGSSRVTRPGLRALLGVLAMILAMAVVEAEAEMTVKLPSPDLQAEHSLEQALQERRSVRELTAAPLTLQEVSQLLWAAQGVTHKRGFRTAPSAGALYPLEIFLATGQVQGLSPGIYRYRPAQHDLLMTAGGDRRDALARAAHDQAWVREGAAVLIIAGVYERTTGKYGKRGIRYVHMEVGHAGQNIFLAATAMGLGTVVVGAFNDAMVQRVLELEEQVRPLSIMPIGKARE